MGDGTTCTPNPCLQPYNEFYFSGPNSGYAGEVVTLAVSGVINPDVKGYSLAFRWDPTVFQYVSGPSFGGTLGEGAMLHIGNNTARSICCAVVYAPACPPAIPAGTGTLCYFTLKVQPDAVSGPSTLSVVNLPPTFNRLTACSGTTLVPALTDEAFNIFPTGACCLGDSCQVAIGSDCISRGGNYLGNGSSCSPNPCQRSSSTGAGPGHPAVGDVSVAPNPGRGSFLISYRMVAPGAAVVEIFNAAGSLVRQLSQGVQAAGIHQIRWDGRDDGGRALSSGVYLTRVRTPAGTREGRLELIR